ncbi:MAG TPA: HAMP domain-containing histidine kinase [Chloroflexus aurantiacus]|jgi:signal transduction histidine kinase|uniref:histidine kinase n=1 Tax=Chloroflexus aurantiacus (strain ATCC 29366 / DSM 635 / J-10-fl) TaxID=324602 RepID=A9WK81_CHLAA|nr:ATP-binding protein [Chloroflexus aurantiacus]ABY35959.1 ATP-binding region ATPase domain protein [Chloroflexus aurantiacus J-10-fl]RMG49410.1 MAG: HAMP domain-containing protein [Chloroflexota bacterium]HBW69164.1 HAMP domain-containing histidine kinase [Chloroflexus aurantiacus]
MYIHRGNAVRQVITVLRSRILFTIILPYLLLMIMVMLVGSGIAMTLVAGSWQERFNNQLGQVARNFAETLALREISNIAYLGQIVFTAANADSGAPAVVDAIARRDEDGLAIALRGLWTLGQSNENISPDRLIVFDSSGMALLDWERAPVGDEPTRYVGTNLAGLPLIEQVLQGVQTPVGSDEILGDKYSGLIAFQQADGSQVLHFFTVAPVYARADDADVPQLLGGVLVAQRLDRTLNFLQERSQAALTVWLDSNGDLLAATVPESFRPLFRLNADQIEMLVRMNALGTCLDIGNLTGRLVTPIEPVRLPTCSLSTTISAGDYEYQLVYAPLLIRGSQSGYFAVGLSRDFILSAWASSRNAVIGVTAGLALAAVIVGYWVARQITRPLDELVAVADAVSAGDLDRRSTVQAENELGRLAFAFNQMTAHLLHLYQTSRQLNRELQIDAILQIATNSATDLQPQTEAIAIVPDTDGWRFRVRTNAPLNYATLTEHALTTLPVNGETQLVPYTDPLLAAGGVQSALVVPLLREQQTIGALIFAHPERNAFSSAVLPHLQAIANMTVVALVNALLYEAAQRDAEQRRAILASISDGVIVSDARGRIVLLNPAARQLLQPVLPAHADLSIHDLPLTGKEARSELFGRPEEVVTIGHRFLTVGRAPVCMTDGTRLGEVIVLHDVTSAIQIDRAKTDFIATISHELRTPLTIVRGYLELILRQSASALDAEQRDMLEEVRQSAIQMTHLVNNAIMVANLDAGQIEVQIQPVALAPVIEEALRPYRAVLSERDIQVLLVLPDDLPPVLADRELLKQALSQLFDNARRYVHQGQILVSAGVDSDTLWLAISDTGPGIPTEIMGRLFTRFQRVDGNNSAQRGGGLGLAITRQLLELQGGSITVTSTPGQGSTFTIRLRYPKERGRVVGG